MKPAKREAVAHQLRRCPWPGCEQKQAGGGLCLQHAAEARGTSGSCPWPNCLQQAASLCYYHQKVAAGLLERSRHAEW